MTEIVTVPISGKDSTATALVIRNTGIDARYIYNDTGADLPEVKEWLNRVELYLGQSVERIESDLVNIIYEQGILPTQKARYCTRLAKIYPMENVIKSGIVAFGIRADENRPGFIPGLGSKIVPIYPLKDKGLNIEDVWQMVSNAGLMPPDFFWQSLYEIVWNMMGRNTHLIDDLKAWERRSLFSWRSRANCFFVLTNAFMNG